MGLTVFHAEFSSGPLTLMKSGKDGLDYFIVEDLQKLSVKMA